VPEWTVKRLLDWTQDYLTKKGVAPARREAEELLAHLLDTTRMDLYLDLERPLTREELEGFKTLVKRRIKGEPLQYITGRQGFWKHEFMVEPGVLIPRPDSEILVQTVVEGLREKASPLILDIGTGTGCLIISILADLPQARGIALDMESKALKLTGRNAHRNRIGVKKRLDLVRGDLLSPFKKESFDAIVSNPPYIAPEEWDTLPREVRDHEPSRALRGGEEGLYYISQIVTHAWECLVPGGLLVVEMGWQQKEKVEMLFKGKPYRDLEFLKDLGGRARAVKAWRK